MGRAIASWFIRFAVAAAVYITVASIWTNRAQGWEGLGLFIASLAFGAIAAVVWWIALAIGHKVAGGSQRLLLHPVLVLLLFLAITVVVGYLMETSSESLWRDLRPFVGLVAAAAVADAAVGWLLQRWVAPPRPAA
jgi:hypothetical protein